MQNPIVRTFMHVTAAEQARAELLEAGIAADDVAIDVRIDETGPVQGNFVTGDAPEVKGKTAYTHTYAPVAQDAVRDCQLTVNVPDPALAERAAAILDRLGALDPDPAARAAAANAAQTRH
ncbi:hypothetical protein QPK32_02340 [Massilia sp. YIM B02763]|uniref:hypothetical protein n=1 Tax=Massilia sp. YIM B02763 TaxID=3050130 RepID=UPI0025B71CEB|nr:hypothetical protein [Massilia sp. YIM B02763]MDN4051926.1 hypothetical protein [Massilia sp. YIM B02763]